MTVVYIFHLEATFSDNSDIYLGTSIKLGILKCIIEILISSWYDIEYWKTDIFKLENIFTY